MIVWASLILGCALGAADFALIRDGKPAAAIRKTDNQNVNKAIAVFNDAVRRCTGTVLPEADGKQPHLNVIQLKLEQLPLDQMDRYTITFPDAKTMRITGTENSLTTAFNHILENHFSCRFLIPAIRGLPYGEEINHYPASKNVSIPQVPVSKSASFNLRRGVSYFNRPWDYRWNLFPGLSNSHLMTIDVFSVYKYAVDQSWPREMLPVLNGKKYIPPKAKAPLPKNFWLAIRPYSAHWNPCFSHPKSAQIAIANILETLDKDPNRKSVCLSINDNGGMCQCPACLKGMGRKPNIVNHLDYSEVYWKWVNTIAEAVHKKYPKVYFTALAYREVLAPPSFKLHKMIVPQICLELVAMNDPKVAAQRRKFLKEWSAKASCLDLWDYAYSIKYYLFPRIYFKSHSRFLQEFYSFNCRAASIECYPVLPFEGPKYYLMAKMMYDIKADPEKIVSDWCRAAVGAKSAPYLRQYYQFWEDYWTGENIKKTDWYASRFSTYLRLGELPTHTLALKKGDMKKLRKLMETVKANTETPEQKRRADVLMTGFEFSELAAQTLFSELLQPNGKLTSAEDAAELLKQVPGALEAHKKLVKHPYARFYEHIPKITAAQMAAIGTVIPYLNEPQVKAAAEKLIADPKTPMVLRSIFKIGLGAKPVNLISNGSFEEDAPLPKVLWSEGGAYRSARQASDGEISFRLPPKSSYCYELKVKPDKTYLFMFDAMVKKTSIEGKLSYQMSSFSGKRICSHTHYLNNRLTGGKWMTFSGVCSSANQVDRIRFLFWIRDFEADDEIYFDNVRVYCLEDLQ